MSNSEPSPIVLQGIPCICGLYTSFDSNGETFSLKIRRDSSSDSLSAVLHACGLRLAVQSTATRPRKRRIA